MGEELTHKTLIQILLSVASTTMTGLMTGELSILKTNLLLKTKTESTHNQILEEQTHRTLIQIPLSAASTTMTGPTTGELSILKTNLSLKPSQTQTTSLQPSQLNIQDQISEDKTHRTPTLTALSLPTYTTTGLTTGITTSIERETIEMMTISCLTSITSSSKLMLKNIQDQTSEAQTHRTLTPISLSLPTYTTTGPTTGTTTSTERETIETMMISCSISTTNSDW